MHNSKTTYLNFFKLNSIPIKEVYKFSIFKEVNDTKKNPHHIANEKKGVYIGDYEIISYLKPKEIEFEVQDFLSIREDYQEKLLNSYLRYNYFIKLNKNLALNTARALPEHNCTIKQELHHSVSKLDKEFYVAIDIKHTFDPLYDILRYCNFDIDKLSMLKAKHKKVRPENSKSTAVIVDIISHKHDRYNKILNDILNYYKTKGKEVALKYENEPILEVMFLNTKNQTYHYLAGALYPVIEAFDIKEKIKELVISNKDRTNILVSIIKENLPYIIEPKPLVKECLEFEHIGMKALGWNGGEKFCNKSKDCFSMFSVKEGIYKILPYKVPEILKGNVIPVFLIADESLKNNKEIQDKKPINTILKSLTNVGKGKEGYPIFENFSAHGKLYYFDLRKVNDLILKIEQILESKNFKKDAVLPLVITLGKEDDMHLDDDYYSELKEKLLQKGFIHQHIILEHLMRSYSRKIQYKNFEIDNLILQILLKYGIYPYVPNINFSYDYIVGVDVGEDIYGDRKIGGAISVFNKNGLIEAIIPVSITTAGEQINIGKLLDTLSLYTNIQDKNLLILRDGILYDKEIEESIDKINRLNSKITFLNIVKNHNMRVLDDDQGRKGIILKDHLALLLNHKFEGARSVKITSKVVIENGNISNEKITEEDLHNIYALSNINYSNIYINSERLKHPAPIHYADKFVKALGKGYKLREDLLKHGYLYFL